MKKLLFLALSFISIAAFAQTPTGYKVGNKAIDFSLKNIDGKNVSLSDYTTAKGFIVIFTTNHCPYAVKYEDRINALNAKYAAAGYPVIAINSDDSVDNPGDSYTNMQVRAKAKGFTFPYLLDASQDIAKAYGANKTPLVYLLQKTADGLIVKYTGAIDDNTEDAAAVKQHYVELAVDALLAGKDITITSTKAIGCGIKIKS
jgi:peroxiredoxin